VKPRENEDVPTRAQDRHQSGPLAALLILLSLLLGSGTAAAGPHALAGPAARPALGQSGAFLLPPAFRSTLDDETPATGDGPAVLSGSPAVVTRLLWARALGATAAAPTAARARPAAFSYRARAPPAA
jgi:hypothetical protein